VKIDIHARIPGRRRSPRGRGRDCNSLNRPSFPGFTCDSRAFLRMPNCFCELGTKTNNDLPGSKTIFLPWRREGRQPVVGNFANPRNSAARPRLAREGRRQHSGLLTESNSSARRDQVGEGGGRLAGGISFRGIRRNLTPRRGNPAYPRVRNVIRHTDTVNTRAKHANVARPADTYNRARFHGNGILSRRAFSQRTVPQTLMLLHHSELPFQLFPLLGAP